MQDISLLPPEIKEQETARRRRVYFLTGCGLLLLVLLLTYSSLLMAVWHTQSQTDSLKNRRLAVERQMSDYQEYVDMVEQIENIGRLLGPITSSSLDWAGLLVNVNHSIPGDVWLTDVTAGFTSNAKGDNASAPGTGGRNQLILRGCSYNYHSLAGWLKDIRHVPELSDVRCQFASEETPEGQPVLSFEIQADISPAGPGGTEKGGK
jgi:Tfp pilus assembly protein PilN